MIEVSYGLGWILGFVLIFVVLSAAGAVALAMAADEHLRTQTNFRDALKVTATALAIASAISLILFGAIRLLGRDLSARGVLVLIGIFFLANALSIMGFLRKADGKDIGLGRASWITVLQAFFMLVPYGFLSWLFKVMTE